jgi:hypothetical protein
MVCIHTSDFSLDMPEASGAHHGVAPAGHSGTAPTSPLPSPPPLPPVSIEQLLAMQNELMRVLIEKLVHRGGR